MQEPAPQQLDIFLNSADVALRNDVFDALERRDAVDARARLLALRDALPDDPNQPTFEILISALESRDDRPLTDHGAVAFCRRSISNEIEPAARMLMGNSAGTTWALSCWRELAARCSRLAFSAAHADDHGAAFWLRGQSWAEAALATASIESWRRIPAPLAWMTEARCRLGQPDQFLPLIAELAWLSPGRLDDLLRRLDDALLVPLYKKFGIGFEGNGDVSDLEWFPAWTAVEKPALAVHLNQAQPGKQSASERAMRLVIELLRLERHGRHQDLVERRKALRDLQPAIFAIYMATR